LFKRPMEDTGLQQQKKKAKKEVEAYPVLPHIRETAHIQGYEQYLEIYQRSVADPEGFWSELARETLHWSKPFDCVKSGDFLAGDIAWFSGGKLNASYQCVDRHAQKTPDKVAILWEGDEPSLIRKITYRELLHDVCRLANVLKSYGVKKGDVVAIYLPMVPEAAIAMLACARLGAPHSVIFAGFSAEALRERILDANCSILITADQGKRGGRVIPLKEIADEALLACPNVKTVLVHKRTHSESVPFHPPRDIWLPEAMAKARPYCPAEEVDSEDLLFILYTSGSTGKPKGVVHTTAGYLLYAATTHRFIFDWHPQDIYACMADIGWITGHSYIVYGPLCNGATTFMFESVPTYPNPARYWDMVERHKINIFYTAPTAIRALMKFGNEHVGRHDRSSLRVLGSVGEPINGPAWKWYYEVVGDKRCSIVDTYWQTETGGIMITPLPGATVMKPGAACFPFFGVKPVLLDHKTGHAVEGNGLKGLLAISEPWPGMARTVFGDHDRYMTTYLKHYPGFYFTGDGCYRDEEGFYWITGRVDDVINVSGHRLGTAEIETALLAHPACSEAAVIAIPHDIKGSAIFVYCTLKEGYEPADTLATELKMEVRRHIGPFATPDHVVLVDDLPKTRSGKIMRRLLRKVATNQCSSEQLGDTSTLADPTIIKRLIESVQRWTNTAK